MLINYEKQIKELQKELKNISYPTYPTAPIRPIKPPNNFPSMSRPTLRIKKQSANFSLNQSIDSIKRYIEKYNFVFDREPTEKDIETYPRFKINVPCEYDDPIFQYKLKKYSEYKDTYEEDHTKYILECETYEDKLKEYNSLSKKHTKLMLAYYDSCNKNKNTRLKIKKQIAILEFKKLKETLCWKN